MARIRFDAAVATFVGLLAVSISAYTAYIQRQQVRAQVWPVLEFGTDNTPEIRVTLANKGVGPASVRHVLFTADGVPVTTWHALVERLLGPGKYNFTESDLNGHVLAPNELMILFQPHELDSGESFHPGKPGTLGARYDEARFRIGAEICYCSTLDECWTLIVHPREAGRTVETSSCPKRSATTFEQ